MWSKLLAAIVVSAPLVGTYLTDSGKTAIGGVVSLIATITGLLMKQPAFMNKTPQ